MDRQMSCRRFLKPSPLTGAAVFVGSKHPDLAFQCIPTVLMIPASYSIFDSVFASIWQEPLWQPSWGTSHLVVIVYGCLSPRLAWSCWPLIFSFSHRFRRFGTKLSTA